jgi:outer membrane protein assembly factor BamB
MISQLRILNSKLIITLAICSLIVTGVLGGCATNFDNWRMDRGESEHKSLIDELILHAIAPNWRVNLKAPIRFSPIIGYGKVFVGTDGNQVHALDPHTGVTLWTYEARGKVSTSAAVQKLIGVSHPILWFTAEDGYVYALNADNGEFLWELEGGGTTWNSSVNCQVPRTVFYNSGNATGTGSKTRAVNAVTGQLLWEKSNPLCLATPMVIHHADLLVQGLYQGGPDKVRAYRTTDGLELWSLQPSPASNQGATTSGVYSSAWNRLYISLREGSVEAYNVSSQYKIWSTELPSNELITGFALQQRGSPTAGTLIVTQRSHTHALEAMTGKIYWTIEHKGNLVDETTLRTPMPAIYGNLVFHVENGNQLLARQLKSGNEVWNFVLDGPVISSPAMSSDSIIVATKAGTVYSFSACR